MRVKLPAGRATVPAVARQIGVNYRTVLALVRRGELCGGRHGHYRIWFVEAASVDAFLNRRATAGARRAHHHRRSRTVSKSRKPMKATSTGNGFGTKPDGRL